MYETGTTQRGRSYTLQAPSDEKDLTLLTGADLMTLPFLWNDLMAMSTIETLGLGVYRFGRRHFIGFTDADSHPHDRWLFGAFEAEHWVRLPAEGFARAGQDVLVHDLRNELIDLKNLSNRVRIALADQLTPTGEMLKRARVLGAPSRNQFDVYEALTLLPKTISNQTLHDLMHHYPQWLVANPAFNDMPRDIVLRTHGLGPLLDTCDWLFDVN